MSDFIDRLISQHLELSPLIQPRQPSRFEPQSVAESGDFSPMRFEQPNIEPYRGEMDTIDPQSFPVGTTASNQPTRSTMRSQQASKPSDSHLTEVNALNTVVSTLADNAPSTPDELEPHSPDIPITQANKVQSAGIEPSSMKLPAIDSLPTTYQSAQPHWEQVAHGKPIASTANQVGSFEKMLVTSNNTDINQEGYLSPPRRSLEQIDNTGNIRSTLPAPHYSPVKAEPPPTIQVSIGRIEIKATPAPTQPRKTPIKPPTMSLDEYLHRRNGGGNR